MLEFPTSSLNLSDSLRRGLTHRDDLPPNYPGLNQLRNMRTVDGRIRPFLGVTDPSDPIFISIPGLNLWPSVRIHVGKSKVWLFTARSIKEFDPSDWTVDDVTICDGDRFDLGDALQLPSNQVTGGGQWHVIDMYDNFVAFNGNSVVWKTGHMLSDVAFGTSSVTIKTGMLYNDSQPIMGGFDPSNIFALADWLTYLKTLDGNADTLTQQTINALTGGAGKNWVWIGTVGGGDLLWFASISLMKRGSLRKNRVNDGWFYPDAAVWTVPADWSIEPGLTCAHTPGSAGVLTQTVANQDTAIVVGQTYRVRYTITSYSAGNVTVALGTASGAVRSANGTYEEKITCAGTGDLTFTPSSTFAGNISRVSVQPLDAEEFGDNFWIGEILPRNESQFIPMPWPGDVEHVKQLGAAVMVYGVENGAGQHGGITALIPNGKHWGVQDIIGFPRGVSLIGRGAVGGDETQHVFLDDTGDLWRVTQDLRAQRLEYKHHLANFDDSTVIEYDPLEQEFYIGFDAGSGSGAADEAYLLGKDGLSRHHFAVSSLGRIQGGLIGSKFTVDGETTKVICESHAFDASAFGFAPRSIFTLREVEVQTIDAMPVGWTFFLSYRMQNEDDWIEIYGDLDKSGRLILQASCLEFMVRLEHDDKSKTDGISAIIVLASPGARGSIKPLVNNGPPGAATI